jgi:Cu/Ag efflux protein CusF
MRLQRRVFSAAIGMASAMVALPALAMDEGKPGAVEAELIVMTATVDKVDQDKRTVTLKENDGSTRTIKIGDAVQNFGQVQPGDQVAAEFYEETAVFVRKSHEAPMVEEAEEVALAPRGAKPGVTAVDTIEVTAKVEAVDHKARKVTLRGPEGNKLDLKVDKRVKKFDHVKAGDEVVVRHTEAVAVLVQAP